MSRYSLLASVFVTLLGLCLAMRPWQDSQPIGPKTSAAPPDSNSNVQKGDTAPAALKRLIEYTKNSPKDIETPTNKVTREELRDLRLLRKRSRLPDLAQLKVNSEFKEVRIWTLGSLYIPVLKAYVFRNTTGQWDGFVVSEMRRRFQLKKVNLPVPKSEWERLGDFISAELGPQMINKPCDYYDSGSEGIYSIVESRFGDNFERRIICDQSFGKRIFKEINLEFGNLATAY
jgi:hypothetical protein